MKLHRGSRWTVADLTEIVVLRQRHRMSFAEIAERFPGRTPGAVANQLTNLGKYVITGDDRMPPVAAETRIGGFSACFGADGEELALAKANLAAEIEAAKKEMRVTPLYKGGW